MPSVRVVASAPVVRRPTKGSTPRGRVRREDGGAILVAVMLIMIVLLGLGMSGLFLTKSNVQMLTNTNLRNQALYVAEAGLERARDILNGPVSPDLTALLGGAGHAYNPADEIPSTLDAVTGLPIGRGAILTDTSGVPLVRVNYPTSVYYGEPVPGNANGVSVPLMGMYTVYIRNDVAECRRGRFAVDGLRSKEVMGGSTNTGNQQGAGGIAAVLCNAGKNACDDNNSVQNNVVVSN
jgi:hypothetical protein